MDISLTSSAILVVIVGLWLVWVVPYFLRHRESPTMQDLALVQAMPAVLPPALSEDSRSQRNIMENTSNSTPAGKGTGSVNLPVTGKDGGARSVSAPAAPDHEPHIQPTVATGTARLKIRYGRLSFALLGLLSFLTAITATAVAVMGLVTAWVPVVALLACVGSVAVLRMLARRDRRKRAASRVDQAFREAMNPPLTADASPQGPPVRKRPSTVFDAETADEAAAAAKAEQSASTNETARPGADPAAEQPALPRLTAEELRQAALDVAAESGDSAGAAAKPTWEPVAVPKPTYVEAAKAERPVPEPLDLPAAPKPEGKPSIKSSATAPKVEVKNGTAAAVPEKNPRSTDESKPATGLHNLDDVLQRRRA